MKNIRVFITAFVIWLIASPIFAQSLTITRAFQAIPNSSVLAQYKNQFGKWEKPDLDDTFPYAVIRVGLDGDGREVQAAKKQLNLYLGQMTAVESVYKDNSNELLFLIPVRSRNIQMDCGDGCDRVTLMDGSVPLRSNTVYYGRVHFVPMAPDSIHVSSGPQIYPLNLRVEPADAKVEIVMLNGIKQECSIVDGLAALKLEEGEYRYTISSEHYYPQEGVISIPTISIDTTFSLNPKVGWLSIVGDSTDLTDLSVELLRMVEPANGKKMNRKEVKQNTSTYSLPLQDLLCDIGDYQLYIEKKKYFDYNRTISINEGDKIILFPKMRPHIMNTFIIAEAGVALNPEWGVGLMFGQMYNGVGWYVKGRSNWNIPKKNRYGEIEFTTTKKTTSLEWIVDAGLVVDFLLKKKKKDKDNFLGLYFGAGYGSRERYWYNADVNKWGKYSPNSYSGVSANIGVMGSIHGITLMAGVNTITLKYAEIEIGIGYTF